MAKTQIPGVISDKDVYTTRELRRRLGLSAWSTWRMSRKGLKVHRIARRKFVMGRDFIAYLDSKQ